MKGIKKLACFFVILGLLAVVALPLRADEDVESKISAALGYYKQGKNEDAIKELSHVLMVLHNKRELEIKNIQLCDEIIGYGDFKKKPSNKIKINEPFLLYFEVEGYGVKKEGETYWFWLSEDASLMDETGKVLFTRNDFLTYRKHYNVPIFPFFMQNKIGNIPAGKYKYEFTVKDHNKKTFAKGVIEFEVEKAASE